MHYYHSPTRIRCCQIMAAAMLVAGTLAAAADTRLGTGATPEEMQNALAPDAAGDDGNDMQLPGGTVTRGIRTQPAVRPAADFEIRFAFGSAELTPQAQQVLDNLGLALQSQVLRQHSFTIEGHTDAVGTEQSNLTLSQRRARAVKNYLVSRHEIETGRLTTIGKGEKELLIQSQPNSEENRRVRVVTDISG